MSERNPIPPCLSHLEQMLPKRASNTAMHFLIKDLRDYAGELIDKVDRSIIGEAVLKENAAEAMVRAAYSLEASLPKAPIAPNDNTMTISFSELVERSGLDEDTLLERLAEIASKRAAPLVQSKPWDASGGMTTAERALLLTTASWLASLLMGHVSVDQSQGGLLPSDGAGILRTQIDALRKESQGG